MNVTSLLHALSTAQMISFLTAVGIPYLSALFTKRPNHLTGVITVALAGLSALLATAQADHFHWSTALGQWLANWALAGAWHAKVLSGTQPEADLHAALTGPAPANPPAA